MSAFAYYLTTYCGNCDEDIFYGLCVTTLEHNGRPVIPYDVASQTNFSCDRCGADNYTGDFQIETEGGTDPADLGGDDLDNDEDDDAAVSGE